MQIISAVRMKVNPTKQSHFLSFISLHFLAPTSVFISITVHVILSCEDQTIKSSSKLMCQMGIFFYHQDLYVPSIIN